MESKLSLNDFDPVAYTLQRYKSAPLKLTFKATNRKDAEAWQKKLRARLVELLGGFPGEKTPLRAQSLETLDFPAFTREKFVFYSRPGVGVLG